MIRDDIRDYPSESVCSTLSKQLGSNRYGRHEEGSMSHLLPEDFLAYKIQLYTTSVLGKLISHLSQKPLRRVYIFQLDFCIIFIIGFLNTKAHSLSSDGVFFLSIWCDKINCIALGQIRATPEYIYLPSRPKKVFRCSSRSLACLAICGVK